MVAYILVCKEVFPSGRLLCGANHSLTFKFDIFSTLQNSIDKAVEDLVQRKRCEEWNWKVGLAVKQKLDYW
jgi:hypothetical protein